MVRFARADGSKGSNKRQLEEATPWSEMVAQMEGNKKKRKKTKDEGGGKKNIEIKQVNKDEVKTQSSTVKKKNMDGEDKNENTSKKIKFEKGQKTGNGNITETQNRTFTTTNMEARDDGNEATKTTKVKGLKAQPLNEVEIRETATQSKVKTSKKERKKERAGKKDTEYTITEEGQRVKVFRDGTERTWFDLPYEESETMTRYEGMWVKKEMVKELDRLKDALMDEGLDKKQIMKKMMKAKRKAHKELRIELIYEQKRLVVEAVGEEGVSVKRNKNQKKKKKSKTEITTTNTTTTTNNNNNNNSKSTTKREKDTELSKNKNTNKKRKGGIERRENKEDGIVNEGDERRGGKEEIKKGGKVKKVFLSDSEDEEDDDKEEENEEEEEEEENNDENEEKDYHEVKKEEKEDKTVTLEPKITDKRKKKKKNKTPKRETEETEEDLTFQTTRINTDEHGMKNTDILNTEEKREEKHNIWNMEEKGNVEYKKCLSENEEILNQSLNDNEYKISKSNRTNKMNTQEHVIKNINIFNSETGKVEYENHLSENEEILNLNLSERNISKSHETNTSPQGEFYESELMTNYEGYWVLREDVGVLNEAKEAELRAIYDARTDRNTENALTREEQITFQRGVKKRKRFHHKRLMQRMARVGRRGDERTRKDRKKDEDSEKAVKFDGFWVKKEAADRLNRLRGKLQREGLGKEEVDAVIQKERRKEERVLKNERKLLCLNCRLPGHMVSACPNIKQAEGDQGQPSICYTCGSTEHTSSTCNLKKGSDNKSFSFATCYICGETGHISRQCPDNPRGLYPKGGACRGCGSVEHLAKDCPDMQKEKEDTNIRVGRMKGDELEGLEEESDEETTTNNNNNNNQSSKLKVVTF